VNYDYDRIGRCAHDAKVLGKQLVLVLTKDDLLADAVGQTSSLDFRCSPCHFSHPDLVVFVDAAAFRQSGKRYSIRTKS